MFVDEKQMQKAYKNGVQLIAVSMVKEKQLNSSLRREAPNCCSMVYMMAISFSGPPGKCYWAIATCGVGKCQE